jgi:hypothetical protein
MQVLVSQPLGRKGNISYQSANLKPVQAVLGESGGTSAVFSSSK